MTFREGFTLSGRGGGFVVPSSASIPFADNAARDVWAAANLGDLVRDQTVVEVTGTPNIWYLWTGETDPATYDNSLWINATPLVRGPVGLAVVEVQSNGVSVTTGAETLNFRGNLLSVDAQGSVANVDVGPEAQPPLSLTGSFTINTQAEADTYRDRIVVYTGTGGANVDVSDSTLFPLGSYIEGINSGTGSFAFRALDSPSATTPIASANPGDMWRVTKTQAVNWMAAGQVLADPTRLQFLRDSVVEGHGIDIDQVGTTLVVAEQGSSGLTGPRISSFNSSTLLNNVEPGTTLTGPQQFQYVVDDPADVEGNLTLAQAGIPLVTNIDPAGSATTQTITDVTLAAGATVMFTLSGVSNAATGSQAFSRSFTRRAAAQQEQAYAYSQTAITAGTQDLTDPSVSPFNVTPVTGQYRVQVAVPDDDYLIIEYPQNRPITSIVVLGLQVDLTTFPEQVGVRTISGITYNARTNRNQAGQAIATDYVVRY